MDTNSSLFPHIFLISRSRECADQFRRYCSECLTCLALFRFNVSRKPCGNTLETYHHQWRQRAVSLNILSNHRWRWRARRMFWSAAFTAFWWWRHRWTDKKVRGYVSTYGQFFRNSFDQWGSNLWHSPRSFYLSGRRIITSFPPSVTSYW